MDRFEFQRYVARKYSPQTMLNIGANEDPAQLKSIDGIINCDITKYPEVDVVFDCTIDRWPFDDDSAECIIFGDIIEHLYPEEFKACLLESHRVGRNFAATIPRDHRILEDDNYADKIKGTPKGLVHVHVYEPEELKSMLINAGFEVERFDVVDYGFVPVGYLIEAHKV